MAILTGNKRNEEYSHTMHNTAYLSSHHPITILSSGLHNFLISSHFSNRGTTVLLKVNLKSCCAYIKKYKTFKFNTFPLKKLQY